MNVNELIPDSIFESDGMLRVYMFLLRNLSPISRKTLIENQKVEIKPNEVFIRRPLDARLRMGDDELNTMLSQLEELEEVHVRKFRAGQIVEISKLPVRWIPDIADTAAGQESGGLPEITAHVFAQIYLKHVADNDAPKTLENAERVMTHFEKRFGNMLLSKLGPQHLEEYKQNRLREIQERRDQKSAGVTTVNIDTRTLKGAMELAITLGYLRSNPFRRVSLIHQEKQLPSYLTKEQFQELLSVVENERMKELFQFAVLTGMRRGEILNLEWPCVDLDNKTISVQSSKHYRVKHGKNRILPMSQTVETLVRGLERCDPFVFMDATGKPYCEGYPTKIFKKAVRDTELDEKLKFHSLRATCATWLAEAGVPIYVIKEILGHAYVKTTESYTRIPTEAMRAGMELITLLPVL